MQLKGKVAFITGGAQGLGKSFAEALLREGCRVCVVDLKKGNGLATVEEFNKNYGSDASMFVACDVSDKSQLENSFKSAIEKFGRLDIVVNNAGISNEENWEKMIDINLKGVMHGTYIGFKLMNKNKGGHGGTIINIASTAGLTIVSFAPAYVASKHGVVSFTRSIAGLLEGTESGHGVQINALCPSFTLTPMTSGQINTAADKMGLMRPPRVAEAFMQLLHDEGRTGAVFAVTPAKMKYRHLGSKL